MSGESIIKFLDLEAINKRFTNQFKDSFDKFLNQPWVVLSDELKSFERNFASYLDVK